MGKGTYIGGHTVIVPRAKIKPTTERWTPTKLVPEESSVVVKISGKNSSKLRKDYEKERKAYETTFKEFAIKYAKAYQRNSKRIKNGHPETPLPNVPNTIAERYTGPQLRRVLKNIRKPATSAMRITLSISFIMICLFFNISLLS